jgi:hypothetical protein
MSNQPLTNVINLNLSKFCRGFSQLTDKTLRLVLSVTLTWASIPNRVSAYTGSVSGQSTTDVPIIELDNLVNNLPREVKQKLSHFQCKATIDECRVEFNKQFSKTDLKFIKKTVGKQLANMPKESRDSLREIVFWSNDNGVAPALQLEQKIAFIQSQAGGDFVFMAILLLAVYAGVYTLAQGSGELDCSSSFVSLRTSFSELSEDNIDPILLANTKSVLVERLGRLQTLCDEVGMHSGSTQSSNLRCARSAVSNSLNMTKAGPQAWVNAAESTGKTILRCFMVDEDSIEDYEKETQDLESGFKK